MERDINEDMVWRQIEGRTVPGKGAKPGTDVSNAKRSPGREVTKKRD